MSVLRLQDTGLQDIRALFLRFGLGVRLVDAGEAIPGSHWGDEEAGLIGHTLYVRPDTPVHSALHEGCHWLLMDEQRREKLHTDAGGTHLEENAVCYLQVLLSDQIPDMGRQRMFADMDAWGYSFRLGSACAWFSGDAEDARAFLQAHRICSAGGIRVP